MDKKLKKPKSVKCKGLAKKKSRRVHLDDVIKECREMFAMIDKNKDDRISRQEMESMLRVLDNNLTDQEVSRIMTLLDLNKNGTIEFEEFVSFAKEHIKTRTDDENELLEAFKIFDIDGDGYITASEIDHTMRRLCHPLSADEIARVMRRGDINDDGKLDYEEFTRIVMQTWKIEMEEDEENGLSQVA